MDTTRMVPGQVWWIKDATAGAVGHEIKGDRLWMVLSDASQNQATGLVTFAPLQMGKEYRYSTDIGYTRSDTGDPVVLRLNQMQTMDVTDKQYKFNYVYSVTPEVLECVRGILSLRFGISPVLPSLEELESLLTRMVNQVFSRNHTTTVIDSVKNLIEEKMKSLPEVPCVVVDSIPQGFFKNNAPEEPESSKSPVKERRDPGRKPTWTLQRCEAFLKDYETKDPEKVMKKWKIETRHRLSQRRIYVERVLRKLKGLQNS